MRDNVKQSKKKQDDKVKLGKKSKHKNNKVTQKYRQPQTQRCKILLMYKARNSGENS